MSDTNKPTARELRDRILSIIRRQIATTDEGRRIVAAGLGDSLDSLAIACAGNLANPMHFLISPEEYE